MRTAPINSTLAMLQMTLMPSITSAFHSVCENKLSHYFFTVHQEKIYVTAVITYKRDNLFYKSNSVWKGLNIELGVKMFKYIGYSKKSWEELMAPTFLRTLQST
jgi:hypothetical protein